MGTWYVVHTCQCFLCSGTSQPTYPGQMHTREPCWQLGWGSWGSALGRSNPQLLDHSWHWSYQHRGCQAEPTFGAGSPYRAKRLQSLAQLGALTSHGALSSCTSGKCMAWHPPTLKHSSRIFLLLLPDCSHTLGKLLSLHLEEREFTYWHKDIFSLPSCYL